MLLAEQWQLENNCSSFQFGFENYSVLWWNAVSMTTDYFLNAGTIEGWWEYLFSFLQWCTRAHLCSAQNIWCVPFALVFYERMHVCCMFDNVPGSSAGVSLLPNFLFLPHPPWPPLSLNHLLPSSVRFW